MKINLIFFYKSIAEVKSLFTFVSTNNEKQHKMKDLKFRINRTKKQRENLTPPKTMVLKVLQDKVNICGELVCLVSCEDKFYQLRQQNMNEFGLKKIIDIDQVKDIRDIDVMNMTNTTKNGTIINYFSIETIEL